MRISQRKKLKKRYRIFINNSNLYFEFCKTAFKPYDLHVISFLIIVKHYLKNDINVSSDGTDNQWFDGKMLCQRVLDYGLGFKLDKDE